jgi:hypothetical protein
MATAMAIGDDDRDGDRERDGDGDRIGDRGGNGDGDGDRDSDRGMATPGSERSRGSAREASDDGLEVVEGVESRFDLGPGHVVPRHCDVQRGDGLGRLCTGSLELRRAVVLARSIALRGEERRRRERSP